MALQGLLCSIDSFLSFVARFVSFRFVSFRFVSSRLVSFRLVYGVIKWYVKLKSLLKIYHNNKRQGVVLYKFKVVQLPMYLRLAEI